MQIFSVDALAWRTIAFLLVFAVALPAAITFTALWLAHGLQSVIGWSVAALFCLIAAGVLAQLWAVRVTIEGNQLGVGGGLYRQTISSAAIRKDDIKPISLLDDSFDMGYRSNGIGMPGFLLGWFRPAKGKRLFVLATKPTAILIPTTGDFDIVVSPVDQDRFITALQAM